MPISRSITGFNRRYLNPVMRPIAGRMPLMGVVEHTGRTSGRPYATPVLLFRSGNRVVIALTYGRDVDWVRNVVAAGGATIRSRGRDLAVVAPVIRTDDAGGVRLPWAVRQLLPRMGVHDFLQLRVMQGHRPGSAR